MHINSTPTFQRYFEAVRPLIKDQESSRLSDHLARAAKSGAADLVRYLIQAGAPLGGHDGERYYSLPMSRAARSGRKEIVELLLRHEAPFGRALQAACTGGFVEIARLLIRGSSHDIVQAAFLSAVERENTAIIELFTDDEISVDTETWEEAIKKTDEQGLESMKQILKAFYCRAG